MARSTSYNRDGAWRDFHPVVPPQTTPVSQTAPVPQAASRSQRYSLDGRPLESKAPKSLPSGSATMDGMPYSPAPHNSSRNLYLHAYDNQLYSTALRDADRSKHQYDVSTLTALPANRRPEESQDKRGREQEEKRRRRRRRNIAIGAVLLLLVLAGIALAVYFAIMADKDPTSSSACTIENQRGESYSGSLKMTIPWDPSLADVSSKEWQNTTHKITATMKEAYRVSNASEIVKTVCVQSLRRGSVVVNFLLFLYEPQELSDPAAVDQLQTGKNEPQTLKDAFIQGLRLLRTNGSSQNFVNDIDESSYNIKAIVTTTTTSRIPSSTTTTLEATTTTTTSAKPTETTTSRIPSTATTTLEATTTTTTSAKPTETTTSRIPSTATTTLAANHTSTTRVPSSASTPLSSTASTTPSPTTPTSTPETATTTEERPRAACGTAQPRPSARIIGGQESIRGAYPWVVLLLINDEAACGGSIMDKTHIITAVHCLENVVLGEGKDRLDIVAGSHLVNYSSLDHVQKVAVNGFYNHRDYDIDSNLNDIAVLRLSRPLTFDTFVSPVCLPDASSRLPSRCTVAGWGSTTSPHDTYPDELREVTLWAYNSSECRATFPDFTSYNEDIDYYLDESVMCAANGTQGGLDACLGDSGGPLFCREEDRQSGQTRYTQYGVVSWGEGCAVAGNPGFYAYLPYYRTWLDNVAIPALAKR